MAIDKKSPTHWLPMCRISQVIITCKNLSHWVISCPLAYLYPIKVTYLGVPSNEHANAKNVWNSQPERHICVWCYSGYKIKIKVQRERNAYRSKRHKNVTSEVMVQFGVGIFEEPKTVMAIIFSASCWIAQWFCLLCTATLDALQTNDA